MKEMNVDENAEKLDFTGGKGYNKGEEKANKPIFRLNPQLFSNIDIHKQTSNWKRELDLIKSKSKDTQIRWITLKNTIRIGIANQKDSKKDVINIGEKN